MDPIATPHVPSLWPEALAALAPTIELGGEHTPESVYVEVMEGRMVLWRNDYAFAVTSWKDTALGRTAYVFVGGREPQRWLRAAIAVWCQWAKDMRCGQIRMVGRPGWKRLVPEAEAAVMLRITFRRSEDE